MKRLYTLHFFASTKNQRYSVRMDLYHDGCTIVAEMFCAVIQCMILSFLYFADYNTGGAGLCCCAVTLLYCTVLYCACCELAVLYLL